ncbi:MULTISPECIES: TetR/AcrR family transcriptional regulator [Saccharibacillus]|uniref:TetR/AcrR family transcriptional regulator n=1 Tax=Saccharibacillus TaxID=456492 RepID=UPI001238F5D0|nr:TetR family transcriptional regulator [Saccharibacillus sp. WB 17]MWJ32542.1 TetR family transcriptional regulator [Saccharibacillus sp. WB 17]
MSETWHRQRKQHNREELIAAGRALFLKRGFAAVAVKDICEQAGVSRVTFYKHFESIDEVGFEVQMQALAQMAEQVRAAGEQAAADSGGSAGPIGPIGPIGPGGPVEALPGERLLPAPTGADRLRAMLLAWAAYAACNRDSMKFILLFDLHYDAYPPGDSLRERYGAFIAEQKERHFLNEALSAGIEDGSLRLDLDLRETGEFIFTAMMGLLQKLSLSAEDPYSPDSGSRRIAARFIGLILGSLLGDAPAKGAASSAGDSPAGQQGAAPEHRRGESRGGSRNGRGDA